MRTATLLALALLAGPSFGADDKGKAVAQQKKAALDAWKAMELGEPAHAETEHLLIYAPKAMAPRLKAVGTQLEKYHEHAAKALNLDPKNAYPGKVTVYLFASKDDVTTFARRIEKRRPMSGETASYLAEDDQLHAAAAPAAGKLAPPVEARAGEMVACVLLQRKAKPRTQLPEWLTQGFGRATSYKALGNGVRWVSEERKQARALVRRHSASDVWDGKVEGEELMPLQASLAEFLSYGVGAARFEKLLAGFAPGEDMESKTTAQAIESSGVTVDRVNKTWKAWVK
jgi:hypothetical protein